MRIKVNGGTMEEPEGTELLQLFRELGINKDSVAVDINGQLIRNHEFPETGLHEGDTIEILHFVGGG